MVKGLYFYKLVSPYEEDITKDCKLTINEIDSNFLNLKNADINHVKVEGNKAMLIRNDGEELVLDLSEVNKNADLSVEYDSIDGVIEISYNGETYKIEGLVTKDNLSKEILTKVYSDCTLEGTGTSVNPLGISSVYQTGHYRPVKKIIDTTVNEHLPKRVMKGERYVTLEEVSDYGMLYNYDSVKKINERLQKTGWRVATKSDWDNMLNAIEPCEHRDHASAINNRVLGYAAGSLLKSMDGWRECHNEHHHHHNDGHHKHNEFDPTEAKDVECKEEYMHHPHPCKPKAEGTDSYGMGILPSGYAYYSRPMQYNHFGFKGAYWTSDMMYDTDVYSKVFEVNEGGVLQVAERPNSFLAVRLVKDYDGTNHNGVENLLGDNYNTVLMPALNTASGHAVWTAENFRFREGDIEATIPNAGLGVSRRNIYFINEWNGTEWERIELKEGDEVVVLDCHNWNESYRVIKGKLTNVTEYITNGIRYEIKEDLDGIRSRIHEAEHAINDNAEAIKKNTARIEDVEVTNIKQDERLDVIEDDIVAIKETHKTDVEAIQDKLESLDNISNELANRVGGVEDRCGAVEERAGALEERSGAIEERIGATEERSGAIEERIGVLENRVGTVENDLINESNRAQEAEKKLQEELDAEKEARENADNELDNRLTEVEGNMIVPENEKGEKMEYSPETGILTLPTANPDNTMTVKFSFDFGEC